MLLVLSLTRRVYKAKKEPGCNSGLMRNWILLIRFKSESSFSWETFARKSHHFSGGISGEYKSYSF